MIRFLLILFIVVSCSNTAKHNPKIPVAEHCEDSAFTFSKINRENIKNRIDLKIKNDQSLVVHIFVPLCDNKNQGIVPVNKSLGDGSNLVTNLY